MQKFSLENILQSIRKGVKADNF